MTADDDSVDVFARISWRRKRRKLRLLNLTSLYRRRDRSIGRRERDCFEKKKRSRKWRD